MARGLPRGAADAGPGGRGGYRPAIHERNARHGQDQRGTGPRHQDGFCKLLTSDKLRARRWKHAASLRGAGWWQLWTTRTPWPGRKPPTGLRMPRIGVGEQPDAADKRRPPSQGWAPSRFMHRADRKPAMGNGGGSFWRVASPVVQEHRPPDKQTAAAVQSDWVCFVHRLRRRVCDPFMGGGTTGEACAARTESSSVLAGSLVLLNSCERIAPRRKTLLPFEPRRECVQEGC